MDTHQLPLRMRGARQDLCAGRVVPTGHLLNMSAEHQTSSFSFLCPTEAVVSIRLRTKGCALLCCADLAW